MPSILSAVRDLERLRQIAVVLGRHGFGELLQRAGVAGQLGIGRRPEDPSTGAISVGERIRLVLTELGPSFIKLGQILSTRRDVIPADIIEQLTRLQDDVPPLPFAELRPQLEQELGLTVDEVYASFNETPLASASIGQVHRATLRDESGIERDVVVKLQRPNIREVIAQDVELLYWLARAIERSVPEAGIYGPTRLVAEFDRAITSELDFALEADNAEKFARNFADFDKGVVAFPKVYRQASSKRVLTLEFLPGKKVIDAVRSGADAEKIAKHAVAVMVKQIYEDGFFHADPHPGNIIIQGTNEDPIIALIDLGLVGRLTPHLRDKTVDLMVAAASEDHRALADALFAIGTATKRVDRRAFEAEVSRLADRYLGKSLRDISLSDLMRDLAGGAVKYGVEIPPDFMLVGKALMTVEGIGRDIYPGLDVFEEVKPYFLRLMWIRYSPEKVSQELIRGVSRLGGAAADLPLQISEMLDDLRRGDVTFGVSDRDLPGALDRLGRRVFSGLVVSVCLLAGAYLVAQNHTVLGAGMLTVGTFWAVWHSALVYWLARKSRP